VPFLHTTHFRRGKLPHWEVYRGRYFVTVRLADSLPSDAILRLQEIHLALSDIEAKSGQFAALQRDYFRTMEKYLDAGVGACWLRLSDAANSVASEFDALREWRVDVPHFTVMPNHWHALLAPDPNCTYSLSAILKRIKGRTAKTVRRLVGGSGPVWQREWFDRWVRNEAEFVKTVNYIQQNPVKSGLVSRYEDHKWTR
jgi:putative transposase